MKTIKGVAIATFSGKAFATLYGLDPLKDFIARGVDADTVDLIVPDSVPDKATVVFAVSQKVNPVSDAEWAKLATTDQKLEALRSQLKG
jgi:hypothetical protein